MHDSKLVYQFAANSLSDKLNFKMKYRKTVHFLFNFYLSLSSI